MHLRQINPDPRRGHPARPGRQQPRCTDEHALGRHHLIQKSQPHHQRQATGQPDGQLAIDHPIAGHSRQALGGPALERLHHHRSRAIRTRPDEHRIDDIVVELRVFAFDFPRRIDKIDPVPHQGQQPPHRRRHQSNESQAEPHPAGPAGQSPRHQPVFREDPAGQPHASRHGRPEQEGLQRRPLVVGAGCLQPLGEIAIGFGGPVGVLRPCPHHQPVASGRAIVIRNSCHGPACAAATPVPGAIPTPLLGRIPTIGINPALYRFLRCLRA